MDDLSGTAVLLSEALFHCLVSSNLFLGGLHSGFLLSRIGRLESVEMTKAKDPLALNSRVL